MSTSRIGRPVKTAGEHARTREQLLSATRVVYCSYGFRGTTVVRIAETAGLSRGTYYKHFTNALEPVEELIDRLAQDLIRAIAAAIAPYSGSERIVAGIDAYLGWVAGLGELAGPLYAESHDPDGPVSRRRGPLTDLLVASVSALAVEAGYTAPDRLTVEAFFTLMEFISPRWAATDSHLDRDRARSLLLRTARTFLEPDI